jgi:glycerophosphoryl diester phosphodiesterase
MPPPTLSEMATRSTPSPLRVGHSIVAPDHPLTALAERLRAADWDMVELDVLRRDGELVVAHDPSDFTAAPSIPFAEALRVLRDHVGPQVRFDVDMKATGYEREVAAAIAAAGIRDRTLISTMHRSSLQTLRDCAPELGRGLSVPLARRNYLASPLTRPGAYAMLAYLRRVLPAQVAAVLDAGDANAIMAHWGVITDRLVSVTRDRGAELFVWTVDDPSRLQRLISLGVSGVISNRWETFADA